MAKIYEYLKEKSEDLKYQDYSFYAYHSFYIDNVYREYKLVDLYNDVNKCIEYLKNNNITNKICFHIVDTSYFDIVTFIALLETGNKVIVVNSDKLYDLYRNYQMDSDNGFPYDVIPSFKLDDESNIYIPNECLLDIKPFDKESIKYHVSIEHIKTILKENIEFSKLDNFDFAILTSGTTGHSKLCGIREIDLINKINNQYDLSKEETFVCQNPISAISGILFTLYIPICGTNKHVYVGNLLFTPPEKLNNHLNIIVPGNYLHDFSISNKNLPLLVDTENNRITSKIDQITLLGTKTSYEVIKLFHRTLYNLPFNKIWIYYGSTENLGLISKINEQDIKPVYLYYSSIYPNKIIYSYDKTNVWESEFINDQFITRKSNIEYNSLLFCEVLPVALLNNLNEDIDINSDIFGEITADKKKTGDYGFKLNNKIYYLCREGEILKLDNGKYYYLSALEEGILNTSTINTTHLNQRFFCINNNGNISIYIPCNINEFRCDNYREYRAELTYFFSQIKEFNIKIDSIYLLDSKNVPYGCEIGKLKRNKLAMFISIANPNKIDTKSDYLNLIKNYIGKELNRDINFDVKYDYFSFAKKDFSAIDIAKILSLFKVLDYKEDDNYYYIVISDDFLFAKFNNLKSGDYHEYLDLVKNHQVREYLLNKYHISVKLLLEIGVFYNDKNELSAVIDIRDSKYVHNDNFVTSYSMYSNIIEREFDLFVEISQYDIYNIKHYFCPVFSIDSNENFYYNKEKMNFDYTTSDICKIMYDFLINNKNCLNNNKTKKLI